MDGVLCNWSYWYDHYAINHTSTSLPNYHAVTARSKTNYSYSEYLQKFGKDFWSTIPPMDWCFELWNLCNSICDTYILTSPSNHGSSAHGKMEWIQKHLKTNKFIITPAKYTLANPNSLLIDDSPKKIDKFINHGGKAFLFMEDGSNLLDCYNFVKEFKRF